MEFSSLVLGVIDEVVPSLSSINQKQTTLFIPDIKKNQTLLMKEF